MPTFTTSRRVEFGDTDMAGIMHFANFFKFMEAAETDFLIARGLSVSWNQPDGRFGLPRVAVACDYLKPARFAEVLTIQVTLEKLGRKSLTYRFDFANSAGEPIACGHITAVLCRTTDNHQIESIEIPADLRDKLQA